MFPVSNSTDHKGCSSHRHPVPFYQHLPVCSGSLLVPGILFLGPWHTSPSSLTPFPSLADLSVCALLLPWQKPAPCLLCWWFNSHSSLSASLQVHCWLVSMCVGEYRRVTPTPCRLWGQVAGDRAPALAASSIALFCAPLRFISLIIWCQFLYAVVTGRA